MTERLRNDCSHSHTAHTFPKNAPIIMTGTGLQLYEWQESLVGELVSQSTISIQIAIRTLANT